MTAPSNQPRAAIRHENGQQPYTDAEIDAGHVLAGVEPPEPSPGFVRSLYHHRRRYRHLADHGTWWVATVTEISRGHDPTGVTVGVPFRWIVTATAAAEGTTHVFHAAPIRRLRQVKDLIGTRVWFRVAPADPSCHVLLPLAPAG